MEQPRDPEPEPLPPFLAPPSPSQSYVWTPPPVRLRFQHRYRTHIILLAVTLFTTTFREAIPVLVFATLYGLQHPFQAFTWDGLRSGLWYSIPLLVTLGAHEMGHYWLCRRHNVDASLPYFLPAPIPLTGTFGAVIRIKEAFPSTRALFDIGVAGPIAGFVVLLPFLYWGVVLSQVVTVPPDADLIYFGEPLLFKAMAWWHFGHLPAGADIMLHPMGFAAWFGMLATALNLLPFGQLDGGHIVHAVLGRRAWVVSLLTLLTTILLTLRSLSWISMAGIMLVMAFFLGLRHPQVIDDGVPLDSRRRLVALLALVIFVLCFTPVPIETFFGK